MALIALSGAMGAATLGTSEPMARRFAHPEAQVLAGWTSAGWPRRPMASRFAPSSRRRWVDHRRIRRSRLLMSSVVDSGGKRSDVLILSGSFSLAQLRKMAMHEGAKMVPYKGLEDCGAGGG